MIIFFSKMDCIKRSPIKLKKHQLKAVKFLNEERQNGLILVHPTGYGKTLTAVVYSQCFLDKYPRNKVIFVGPSGLLNNFRKEMSVYGVLNKEKYELYSYQKFHQLFNQDLINCRNNLLIVDEVHNLRNLALRNESKGISAKAVYKCAIFARKRLLLTATPFINDLMDFESLINFVYGGMKIYKRTQLSEAIDLKKYLKNKVDFISLSPEDKKLFPTFKEEYKYIPMPKEYEQNYCRVIRGYKVEGTVFLNPSSFYNAHRRAVNKIGTDDEYLGMKMKTAIELIGDKKAVIFSNWLKYGLEPIQKALKKAKIKSKSFSGKDSESQKKKIVEEFNQDKFQVLIITSAGKEGLDLKGVRKLIVMDPVWNFAGIEQIKGRAVRMGSHLHLPEKERTVDIYYLILSTSDDRTKTKRTGRCFSGDALVYQFVENKKKIQKKIDKVLKEISI